MRHVFFRSALMMLGLVLGSTCAASAQDADWSDNVPASLKKAGDEGKDVVMDFTGSDWCGWCMKLKSEVFDQDEFKKQAPSHFVLVELDFPQNKKMPEAITAQNAEWMRKFGVSGFPTIMLVDAKGRPFAQLGYAAGGPGPYLKTLEEMRARRVARDEKWAAAAKAEGMEKIKLLDEALCALKDDKLVFQHYGAEVEELLKLDADGKAGVKPRYADRMRQAQAQKLFEAKVPGILNGASADAEDAIKKLQALAADKRMNAEFRQKTLFLASQVCRLEVKDLKRAEQLFDQAIAADPDSEVGVKLQTNRARIFPKTEPVAEPKPNEAPVPAPAPTTATHGPGA